MKWLKKILSSGLFLSFCSIIFAIGLFEIGFLVYRYQFQKPFIWPANLQVVLEIIPEITPGVEGDSTFTTNSMGIRGREIEDSDSIRILCAGGSTTECGILDDSEAWPQQLESYLRSGNPGVWVGNAGVSGMSLATLTSVLESWLDVLPDPNFLVILSGINDFALRLERDDDFLAFPYQRKSFLETSGLFTIWRHLFPERQRSDEFLALNLSFQERFLTRKVIPGANLYYQRWRQRRQNASRLLTKLPRMREALDEYTHNLNEVIDIARARDVIVLFLTQPTIWRPEMSPADEDLLWFGWQGDKNAENVAFYTVPALAKGIARYNQALRKVCENRNVELLDLAAMLPKDTTIFYDDCHFNEAGAERVGEEAANVVRSLIGEY